MSVGNNMRIATFSGTFDPVTEGHVDIIERAAKLFDGLYVAIAVNPDKKTMFTEGERLLMLERTVGELSCRDKVKCVVWERPVFELCRKVGADVIVKGVRSSSDFEYEKILAAQTDSLCPGIETVCLIADGKYEHISSTYVRGCIGYGFSLDGIVPSPAIEVINTINKE